MMNKCLPSMLQGVGHRKAARWNSGTFLGSSPSDAERRFKFVSVQLSSSEDLALESLEYPYSKEISMGDRKSLRELRDEVQQIGQQAYQFEKLCPDCQEHLEDFWERLDWLDSRFQNFLYLEEENKLLQYKIGRYLDFGEPLDYC